MQDPRWRSLTDSAKDLIVHLLSLEPKTRYTAKMALNHSWIKGARDDSVLDGSVMDSWHDPTQNLPHAAFMGTPCTPLLLCPCSLVVRHRIMRRMMRVSQPRLVSNFACCLHRHPCMPPPLKTFSGESSSRVALPKRAFGCLALYSSA